MPDDHEAAAPGDLLQIRLRAAVDKFGSVSSFADHAGVPKDTINKYLAGMQPKPAALIKLADAAGWTIDYLVGRQGADVAGSGTSSVPPMLPVPASGSAPSLDGYIPIPRLDVQASAGGGQVAGPDAATYIMMLHEGWLRTLGIQPRNAQLVTAIGDSMEPTIRDGDLLLVDRGITAVIDNGIYIVVVAGLVLVKRLQMRFDGSLTLLSDNRDRYEPETIKRDMIHELTIEGRVKWYGRSI